MTHTNESLAGKRALVTGSVQGIGLAIAETLAGCGAAVVVHGLGTDEDRANALQRLRDAGAGDVQVFKHDLREPAEVEALMRAVFDTGSLDILVNNAGIQRVAPLAETRRRDWDDILAVNLSAAFDTMRLALPQMAARGYGRVINIASVHGLVASIHKAPYVAAKHGLIGLSKVAALEYASAGTRASGGVTVNCICPAWTETAIIAPQIAARASALGVGHDDAIRVMLQERQPSQRTSLPFEIARTVAWLCEPAAHNMTGVALPVDGGWTAQ